MTTDFKYLEPYQDITRQIFILILYACFLWIANGIGDVIVIVLASSAVDRGFEPGSGQTKVNKIGIFSFSAKHAALRRKNRDWITRNQDNVCRHVYPRIVVSVC